MGDAGRAVGVLAGLVAGAFGLAWLARRSHEPRGAVLDVADPRWQWPAASPDVLTHEAPGVLLSSMPIAARGAIVAAIGRAYCGLGAQDDGRGRNGAYADAVAIGESADERGFLAPLEIPASDPDPWRRSSCGMHIRRVIAAAGVDAAEMLPPYKPSTVIAGLEGLARRVGAWRGPSSSRALRPGDAVMLSGGKHVLLVLETRPGALVVSEGGQRGGLGGGTEIACNTHAIADVAGAWQIDGRPVYGVIEIPAIPVRWGVTMPRRGALVA